jgi:hypothetical protein
MSCYLLLILQSSNWLTAFHPDLLIPTLFTAVLLYEYHSFCSARREWEQPKNREARCIGPYECITHVLFTKQGDRSRHTTTVVTEMFVVPLSSPRQMPERAATLDYAMTASFNVLLT